MPAKDSQSKTSKTARVMNLLSKKPDSAPEGGAAESAAPESAAPAPSAPVPPIITSLAPDAAVAGQIKDALENELANALGAPAPAQPEIPVEAAAPVAPPAPAVSAQAEAPAQHAATRYVEPEDPGYINVMQVLVEEKAEKYTKLAGMCQCKRCLEDVKALTLNNLPPKYVVLADGERVPRLTVYESRYGSDITSQLCKACEFVSKRPHHSRPEP